jgi:hypothetical protein
VTWFQTVRRLIERHPFATDAALAVAFAALVLSDVLTSGDYLTASKAIYVPAVLLMTLPLAWRRHAPLLVAAVVMGALVFESLAVGSAPTPDLPLIGWLLAIYTVAAHSERFPALFGGAFSLAAVPESIEVELAEVNASGQSGTATLTPNGDGTLDVMIDLSQGSDEPQPAHIHEGSCPDVGDVVAPLKDVVDGTSTSENVAFSLDDLTSTESPGFAINVHKSAAAIEDYVACGDITDVSLP